MIDPQNVSPRKRKTTLLEHWGVYSATLPTSGTMRRGQLFPLQQSEHPTSENESSSSRGIKMLPTPRANDHTGGVKNRTERGYADQLNDIATLLPTPAVNDMGAAYTPEQWDAWTERMKSEFNNGNGHGKSLNVEAQRLLPTPSATLATAGPDYARQGRPESGGHDLATAIAHAPVDWGEYGDAVRRWERVLGRPAPSPTMLSKRGKPQLAPEFVEWMMGLEPGWFTSPDIGLTRAQQLRLGGNGVVPQQALYALTTLTQKED